MKLVTVLPLSSVAVTVPLVIALNTNGPPVYVAVDTSAKTLTSGYTSSGNKVSRAASYFSSDNANFVISTRVNNGVCLDGYVGCAEICGKNFEREVAARSQSKRQSSACVGA